MSNELGRRPSARAVPRQPNCEAVYDAHASALLALADAVLDDPVEAQSAVIEVLRGAGGRRRPTDDRAERRTLARAVYARCMRARLGSGPSYLGTEVMARGVRHLPTELSDHERAALALAGYGAHTYTEAADVLALPPPVVAGLLRTGLSRLAVSGGR